MPEILKTSKICFNCKKRHNCLKLQKTQKKEKNMTFFFAIKFVCTSFLATYKESNKNEYRVSHSKEGKVIML